MVGLVMGLVLYRFSETVVDPDLSGHLKFGQIVWETGKIAMPDPFSYVTAGQLWVNHEWLTEVIWYLVFALVGPAGLIGLKVSLGLLVHGLVYRHLRRQDVSRLRASLIVLAMMHFFLITLITVRPLIVTYPLFLFVLLLIYQMAHGRTRWLWTAPVLFVVWANLHPGFLAGLAVLAIWAAVELFGRRVGDRRVSGQPALSDLAIIGVLCLECFGNGGESVRREPVGIPPQDSDGAEAGYHGVATDRADDPIRLHLLRSHGARDLRRLLQS